MRKGTTATVYTIPPKRRGLARSRLSSSTFQQKRVSSQKTTPQTNPSKQKQKKTHKKARSVFFRKQTESRGNQFSQSNRRSGFSSKQAEKLQLLAFSCKSR